MGTSIRNGRSIRRKTLKTAAIVASASMAALATATVGLAQNGQGQNGNNQGQNGNNQGHYSPAPAPSIGAGVPAILAVGGTLLGATLLGRLRKR